MRKIRGSVLGLPERTKVVVMSIVVGLACGFAATILSTLVSVIHTSLTSWFSGSDYNFLFLIYPGIGMLLAMLIVRYVIKDNIGHGVTKVLVAVSKNESKIKPHNMWSSIVTSALTIGFGGSVGAEAPIVYTGAAIGSNFARYMGMSYKNMNILLGCGAAGAIAGIFKAPLAGVLFTFEILLFNMSMSSMMPMLLSTVSATTVSYLLMGDSLPFECTLSPFAMKNIPFYIILGFICGFSSLYFVRTTLWLEDKLGDIRHPFLKWGVCALLLGLLIFLFPPLYGEGYSDLHPLLNGQNISFDGQTLLAGMLHAKWLVPLFFLMVFFLKVFSMSFTNAGGGVGGTFGPTLFCGAVMGFVVARTMNLLLVGTSLMVPEQNFVLVGMAGLMAGVMQAPMTAIFLIAEISGGYELFLPLILTSAVSFGTMRIFEKYSIYTKRIAQEGDLLTHDSDQSVLTLLKVHELVETNFRPVNIDMSLRQLVHVISESNRNLYPVLDSHNRFQGYVSLEDVRHDMFQTDLYDKKFVFNYMHTAPEYVFLDEKMGSVMHKFETTDAWNLPVVRRDRTYVGFVSKSKIFNAYRRELKLVSSD